MGGNLKGINANTFRTQNDIQRNVAGFWSKFLDQFWPLCDAFVINMVCTLHATRQTVV